MGKPKKLANNACDGLVEALISGLELGNDAFNMLDYSVFRCLEYR
jgi:hypothetical protein